MSRPHAPVTRTADTDAAAYLLASGLILLRIEADDPRAMYVFDDRQARGRGLRAAFVHDAPMPARTLLRARRHLIRGVQLAQDSPARCLTGSELAPHWARVDAANRASWDGEREPHAPVDPAPTGERGFG
jgi:hypothetical protein